MRGTTSVVQIIEKVIEQNDKARAEIVFDVEILEVNRVKAKQYGLNLSEYALGGGPFTQVSPGGSTTAPASGTGTTTTTTVASGSSTSPSGVKSPPPFNLNTISRGFTTSDFCLAVPTAIVHVRSRATRKPSSCMSRSCVKRRRNKLARTSATKFRSSRPATPDCDRRCWGESAELVPVEAGRHQHRHHAGACDAGRRRRAARPQRREQLARSDVNVAGTNYPSFGSRKVGTRLRLRDGESNLLAGLLREDERKSLNGFPGAIRVPILKQLFSNNDQTIGMTDIVILLTPHILRAQPSLKPTCVPSTSGSQGNLGIGGPPPLIGAPHRWNGSGAGPDRATTPGPRPRVLRLRHLARRRLRSRVRLSGTTFLTPPGHHASTDACSGSRAAAGQPEPRLGAGRAAATPSASAPAASPSASATSATDSTPLESPGLGAAQVIITPPSSTFRVGAGPYDSGIGAERVAPVDGDVDADVRSVDAARAGGERGEQFHAFGWRERQLHAAGGSREVDVTIARAADATGATGAGLLSAIPVRCGWGPARRRYRQDGTATGPGGTDGPAVPARERERPAMIRAAERGYVHRIDGGLGHRHVWWRRVCDAPGA